MEPLSGKVIEGQGDASDGRSDDRRRWPRTTEPGRARLTVLSAPQASYLEGRHYYCHTENLSAGGFRFCVHSQVPLASILKIEVTFSGPDEETFVHIGRVAWEQEFKDDGLAARWLGVEITETLGGNERFRFWQHIVGGLRPSASDS